MKGFKFKKEYNNRKLFLLKNVLFSKNYWEKAGEDLFTYLHQKIVEESNPSPFNISISKNWLFELAFEKEKCLLNIIYPVFKKAKDDKVLNCLVILTEAFEYHNKYGNTQLHRCFCYAEIKSVCRQNNFRKEILERCFSISITNEIITIVFITPRPKGVTTFIMLNIISDYWSKSKNKKNLVAIEIFGIPRLKGAQEKEKLNNIIKKFYNESNQSEEFTTLLEKFRTERRTLTN